MTGEEIVKQAFDELSPERQHDILLELGIHDELCEICNAEVERGE